MKDISQITEYDLTDMSDDELIKLQRSLRYCIWTDQERTARLLNREIHDEWLHRKRIDNWR